jgi:hypothetical protein
MTLREKMLYHQIHPAKLIVDAGAAIAAAVLFWHQHVFRGLAVGLAPPILASILIIQFVDLENVKHSSLGRYAARHRTPLLEIARLVGIVIVWTAAWYRSGYYCFVGSLVITFAWARGALQESGQREV